MTCIKPRLSSDGSLRSKNMVIKFLDDDSSLEGSTVTPDKPIILVNSKPPTSFAWDIYKMNLKTKVLGQTVIYSDLISSTMHVFDG